MILEWNEVCKNVYFKYLIFPQIYWKYKCIWEKRVKIQKTFHNCHGEQMIQLNVSIHMIQISAKSNAAVHFWDTYTIFWS